MTRPKRIFIIGAAIIAGCCLIQNARAGKIYLGADSRVDLVLTEPLTTAAEKPPAIAAVLDIASPISVGGIEVFRKGCRIFGEVSEFTVPGRLGKPGALKIRVDSLQTIQGKIVAIKPLILSSAGKGKKLKAYLTLPLLGYGYFCVRGEDATLGEKGQVFPVKTAKFEEIQF